VAVAATGVGASFPPLSVQPAAAMAATVARAVRPARTRTMPSHETRLVQAAGQYGKVGEFSHRLF
jgi:hypothetical protein